MLKDLYSTDYDETELRIGGVVGFLVFAATAVSHMSVGGVVLGLILGALSGWCSIILYRLAKGWFVILIAALSLSAVAWLVDLFL